MLKIYTTDEYSEKFAQLDTTYAYPEEKRGPWEQFEWFDNHLEEFKNDNVSIKTFSPYFLNYINLKLAKGELEFDNIEVVEMLYDKETNEYFYNDLKVVEKNLIDSRLFSNPISWIYQEYNKIKNN